MKDEGIIILALIFLGGVISLFISRDVFNTITVFSILCIVMLISWKPSLYSHFIYSFYNSQDKKKIHRYFRLRKAFGLDSTYKITGNMGIKIIDKIEYQLEQLRGTSTIYNRSSDEIITIACLFLLIDEEFLPSSRKETILNEIIISLSNHDNIKDVLKLSESLVFHRIPK